MKQTFLKHTLKRGLLVTAAAVLASAALAQSAGYVRPIGPADRAMGSVRSPFALGRSVVVKIPASRSKSSKSYKDATYATGGVALRNRGSGVIHISGLPAKPTIMDAYIYWVYLYTATPPTTQKITVSRISDTGVLHDTTALTGKMLETVADPCWGSSGGAVYRAQVPKSLAVGNGMYLVTLAKGATALTNGEDPWDGNAQYPMAEGASLVIVAEGAGTVALYDSFGAEFQAGYLDYTLKLPSETTGNAVLFDNIGADGQLGGSRDSYDYNYTDDTVTINGVQISGPGGLYGSDSDWDGSSGWPLPQLWDDTGHLITEAAPSGTSKLAVSHYTQEDCLIGVANVVSY